MAFSSQRNPKVPVPYAGQRTSRLWKDVAAGNMRIGDYGNQIAELQRQISTLQIALANVLSGLYPFQIYQLPYFLRQTNDPTQGNFSDDTDWRKVRVRTGGATVMFLPNATNPVQIHSIINVQGTDNALNPDIETYLDDPTVQDIVVPENDPAYAIWVTLTVTNGIASFQLFSGDDPGSAGDNSGWASFPQNDQYHQLIGFVDSATNASSNVVTPRQIARADMLFAIC